MFETLLLVGAVAIALVLLQPLAEAGVDRTYISALERRAYSASITMVEKLAGVLGVDPADLLRRPAKPSRRA